LLKEDFIVLQYSVFVGRVFGDKTSPNVLDASVPSEYYENDKAEQEKPKRRSPENVYDLPRAGHKSDGHQSSSTIQKVTTISTMLIENKHSTTRRLFPFYFFFSSSSQ
jgi:hypothetical protein